MSTHDNIELPPLPVPRTKTDGGIELFAEYSVREYARAAIKPYQKRIEELEAQLEAIGAGGVSSQRITSQRRGEPVAFAKDGNLFWRGDPVAWREFSGELYLAPQPVDPVELDRYDAGLLGGQDGMPAYVWHDIIRAELDRAYDFYMDQLDRATPQPAEPVKAPSDAELRRMVQEQYNGDPVEFARALLARYGQPVESEEPTVRYCPGCGSIGPVESKYHNCCPDGNEARAIPQKLAEKCRDTFLMAIRLM